MDLRDDLVSIPVAAKRIGMGRERLRQFAVSRGLAIKWGGTEKKPIIRVSLKELERAIMGNRVPPPWQQQTIAKPVVRRTRQRRLLADGPLHPSVKF